MIRLFDRDETNFDHNETPLPDVISAIVELESNGMYELVLEYPRNDFAKTLTAGKVLKADTPKGEQLFRIYKPIKNLKTYTIYARHVFYDLAKNFIENVRPTNTTGNSAIQTILSGVAVEHGFSGSSDIAGLNTANYVRMSPIQALLGADNAFLKVWGGELTRDNFTFRIDAQGGQDRGYEIRLGKNLIGIEADVDETNVYTCIYPTVVIDGNTVTTLPEKYIYSPLVDNYESTYVIEERIELSDEEKELPLELIYTLMRERVTALFEQGIDKPEVNYKIDFVELSKTEQYKDLQILEQLDMYDTVHAIVDELDIRVNAKVIKYAYDSLRKRFVSMELGNFKQNLASQTKNTLGMVEKQINQSANLIREAFERSNDLITGNRGGHVVMRRNAEGLPYEILIMDTDDIQTAQNVIRMNQQGIGFSETGYNGPFGVAITIDGNLNAEIMNVFNVNADNIVGNTSEFVRSAWNELDSTVFITGDGVQSSQGDLRSKLHAATLDFSNLARGLNTSISGNGILGSKTGTSSDYERLLEFIDEGMRIKYISGDNTQANTSLILESNAVGAVQYVDFLEQPNSNNNRRARLEHEFDTFRLLHPSGGKLVVMSRNRDADAGVIESGWFRTTGSEPLELRYNFLQTPRTGNRHLKLAPNGTGEVQAVNAQGEYYNMRATTFVNASSRKLKTNFGEWTENATEKIMSLNMLSYDLKKDVKEGIDNRQYGLIAEDSRFLTTPDGEAIDIYKWLSYLTKAFQEQHKGDDAND